MEFSVKFLDKSTDLVFQALRYHFLLLLSSLKFDYILLSTSDFELITLLKILLSI